MNTPNACGEALVRKYIPKAVLNSIQREEQEHGKRIYDYMSANNMYA